MSLRPDGRFQFDLGYGNFNRHRRSSQTEGVILLSCEQRKLRMNVRIGDSGFGNPSIESTGFIRHEF